MKSINTQSNFDNTITIVIIIFAIILFSAFQLSAQEVEKDDKSDKKTEIVEKPASTQAFTNAINFKNETGNAIITITDEGSNKGSITLPQMATPPSSTQYKLYNENGTLKYNGTAIGSGSATEIDNLTDAKYDGSSLFLGEGSGALDDGTDNNNTAIGKNALQSNTTGNNNTAVGNIALFSNTTGSGNSAYGFLSLNTNTTGNNNTAIGSGSLWFNETGNANTAIGYNSLSGNSTGEGNTANGVGSLRFNSTGNANTANGNGALFSNTIGSYNIGIGSDANSYNQTGSYNTIIGFQAGQGTSVHNKSGNIFLGYQAGFNETSDNKLYIENSNSSTPLIWGDFSNDEVKINGDFHVTGNITTDGTSPGATEINDLIDAKYDGSSLFLGNGSGVLDDGTENSNTAVGYNSLNKNVDGFVNTAVGYSAMQSNVGGYWNSAFGSGALFSSLSGSINTAVGMNALFMNTSSGNVGIGYNANYYNQSGASNTVVGSSAGGNTTTPHNSNFNVFLGSNAGYNATGSSNIFIGYSAGYDETTSNKLYIENSNSTSPLIWGDFASNRIVINGNAGSGNAGYEFFVNGDAGGLTAWNNLSDERLKKNVSTIINALEKVNNLRGVNYEWKDSKRFSNGIQMGFIAQEADKIIPEVVDDSGEYYTMQYAPITALLVEAVKEQNEKFRTQNAELLKKIKELEKENAENKIQNTEFSTQNKQLEDRLSKLESLFNSTRFTAITK